MKKIIIFLFLSSAVIPFRIISSPVLSGRTGAGNDTVVDTYSAKYIGISSGGEKYVFRDYGISPLFYTIYLPNAGIELAIMEKRSEWNFSFGYSFTHYSFSRIFDDSQVNMFHYQLNWLREWFRLSNEKWKIKLGPTIEGTTIRRWNGDFVNTAYCIESFNTMFVSGKLERNIQIKAKNKKFLFIKYRQKMRGINVSYQLNLPVINTNIRPQYSYFYYTENAWNRIKIEGYRFSSIARLNYYLQNGNALGISYYWDALSTNSDFNKLESATHIVKIMLLFKINK